jgi:hypothetical protein
MRLNDIMVAACLCLPAAGLAQQQAPAVPPASLQGLVSEEDVTAVFAYLRSALAAAAEGREVPPVPEELRSRMEMLGADLKLRGSIAGMLLLKSLEAQVKEIMRGSAPPSPAVPPSRAPYERSSASL